MDWYRDSEKAAERLGVPASHLSLRLRDGAIVLWDRPTTDQDRVVLRVLPPLGTPWTDEAIAALNGDEVPG